MNLLGARKLAEGEDSYEFEGAKVSFAYVESVRVASMVIKQLELSIEAPSPEIESAVHQRLHIRFLRGGG